MEEVLLLIFALLWDILLGEPKAFLHPVVITGKLIEKIDICVNKKGKIFEFVFGGFLVILGILIFWGMFFTVRKTSELLLGEFYNFRVMVEFLVSAFFLKSTFAIRSMNEHAKAVLFYLKKDDITRARNEASKIVSRSTENLGKSHLISSTVESVAENFVDSVVSPVFFFVIAGIEGAIFYRVVNILDAMIGYKNERYMWRGFVAARLDDIINFIPARLSILFILVSSFLLRIEMKEIIGTLKDFKKATESPNSYIPMCLFAGALKVKLEKIGFYSIGNFELPSDDGKIEEALKLMNLSSFVLFCVASVAVLVENLL